MNLYIKSEFRYTRDLGIDWYNGIDEMGNFVYSFILFHSSRMECIWKIRICNLSKMKK